MQRPLLLIIVLLIAALGLLKYIATSNTENQGETISISGAFALYPISIKWADEFKRTHPGVRFDISAGGAGKGISDVLAGLIDIGAVSRDLHKEEVERGAQPIPVAIDAVVPTMNPHNRNFTQIQSKGVTRQSFIALFAKGTLTNSKSLGGLFSLPIHPYTRSDAAGAADTWAKYVGIKQEDLIGTGVYGDPGLMQAIQRDEYGIGFNNISYVYDPKTKKVRPGIAVVPIDVNENGTIDPQENFYQSLDSLMAAIAQKRYPSPPARKLYFVTKNKSQRKIVNEFLDWVVTDGQKYLTESGYIPLK